MVLCRIEWVDKNCVKERARVGSRAGTRSKFIKVRVEREIFGGRIEDAVVYFKTKFEIIKPFGRRWSVHDVGILWAWAYFEVSVMKKANDVKTIGGFLWFFGCLVR